VNPQIPAELERILQKAVEKDRELRHQHAAELRADLKRLRRDVSSSGRTQAAVATPPAPIAVADASSDSALVAALAKRHKRSLLLGAFTALLVFAGGGYALFRWFAPPPLAGVESVAVLPFANVGGNTDAEYLSDGVAESLINSLSKLPGLRVVSRSSAFSFKGKNISPVEAGRQLKVQAVITGRVQQRGDSLVVSAELVDAATDAQIWGERYERKASELMAVQGDIARALAAQLRPQMSSEAEGQMAARPTTNSQAYELYLRGRFHWNRRDRESLAKGLECFQQAVALDPNFALAHAGLADSYLIQAAVGFEPGAATVPKARDAALRALELDPTLAEPHSTLGVIYSGFDRDSAAAEREFKLALERNPLYPTGHQWYGEFLSARGRHDEAVQQAKMAVELDPLAPRVNLSAGMVSYFARRFDEALRQFRKALELGDPDARQMLITTHVVTGKVDALFSDLAAAGESPESIADARKAYEQGGVQGVWRVLIRPYYYRPDGKPAFSSPTVMSWYEVVAGNREAALRLLEKGVEDRDLALHDLCIKYNPSYDSLRSEPRFQAIVRQMNLDK
jgi:TolB-like protein